MKTIMAINDLPLLVNCSAVHFADLTVLLQLIPTTLLRFYLRGLRGQFSCSCCEITRNWTPGIERLHGV